jgi:hypothetical protein
MKNQTIIIAINKCEQLEIKLKIYAEAVLKSGS